MGLELDRMKTKIKFDKTKEDEIKICRAPNICRFNVGMLPKKKKEVIKKIHGFEKVGLY